MPNWAHNYIKIYGDEELKRKFIEDFLRKGFESIVPMPEPLKRYNTETSLHWNLIEKVTKGKVGLYTYDEESKTLLLQELQKYEPENEEEERLKYELIECLKTGYYSWRDFALHNWGTKWQPWDVEYDEEKDVLIFTTAWNEPGIFLTTLSEKLSFTIKGETICYEFPFHIRYRIENGQITMMEDLTEELIEEMEAALTEETKEKENKCFIETESGEAEKTGKRG